MNRKEEIIQATLSLASEKGLSNISMSQIAEFIGIKKPSLYNHFKSKDEIIEATYQYLRNEAKSSLSIGEIDYARLIEGKSLKEILMLTINNYNNMNMQESMLKFYKIIYAERTFNPLAAKILIEETNRMVNATKNLFYALQVHKKLNVESIDVVATSFAMIIHAFMDYNLDLNTAKEEKSDNLIKFIDWFSNQFAVKKDEKNFN